MANFVLVYTGGTPPQSEAEGAAVMQAWIAWFTELGAAVVDAGNPFTPVAKHIASNGSVSDNVPGVPATGYSVLKADSLDAAVKMAQGCPQLKSGGQISVYEAINVM